MYHIIINELRLKGKHLKDVEAVKSVFEKTGKEYTFHYTQKVGDAKRITQEISSKGELCTVIAMVGDGTLHDVVNGVVDFENTRVGLIPMGSGNDFAAAVNIPHNAKTAAELIAFKVARPIDFIQLSSGLRSINAIGMGIDVDVLRRTYGGKATGKGKYLKAFIVSLAKFKSVNFTVKYEDKEEKHFGLIAALGNGKQIGGGIKVFPEAKVDDGYMDLIIVDYLTKFKTLIAFIKLMMGKIGKVKEAKQIRCKKASLILDEENYTIQAEGELYDNVPLEAEIVSNKLQFYYPDSN